MHVSMIMLSQVNDDSNCVNKVVFLVENGRAFGKSHYEQALVIFSGYDFMHFKVRGTEPRPCACFHMLDKMREEGYAEP